MTDRMQSIPLYGFMAAKAMPGLKTTWQK